jgi:hypothetical protein
MLLKKTTEDFERMHTAAAHAENKRQQKTLSTCMLRTPTRKDNRRLGARACCVRQLVVGYPFQNVSTVPDQ